MARLNDPPLPGSESLEAVKKRYIRQNREIARVNSAQSIRIRSLESEATRLLSENIELREQVIKLQAVLDKRERSKVALENVDATKKQLEGKVAEIQELVKSLGQVISFSPQAKPPPKQRAYIVSPEQRTWKSGLSFSEVMGIEGSLPAISEDARSRRSSLNVDEHRRTSLDSDSRRNSINIDENRRNNINFEEIRLLPTPLLDDAESDEDLRPPVSNLFDIRPRRRRDSALPVELEALRPPKAKSHPTVDTGTKLKKRRYEDRDQAPDAEPPLNLNFKFTKLSQRTTDVTNQLADIQKPSMTLVMVDDSEGEPIAMDEEELTGIEKIVEAGRRAVRLDFVEQKELIPTRDTATSSAASTMGRRALGPKSTNSDPSNSPLKQTTIRGTLPKDRGLEKPERTEFNGPPKMKSFDSKVRDIDIPPPDSDANAGRPSRRARTSVNYALPNLRDKMRRDDKTGEPLKSEGKTSRRATTGGRLRNKDSAEALVTKQIEFDEVEGIVGKQWPDLLTLPHTTLAANAGEEPRKIKETGMGELLERKPSRENDMERGGLPMSVMTHRKRRSSNLHQGPLMDLTHGGTNGSMLQITNTNESRRKTVSFDPSSTGGEGSQPRNRTEGTSLKRKQMTQSHLPPASVVDVGEASAALSEAVRSSRRITLGGATKGVRGARSHNNLAGNDETEVEDDRPTSAMGMASRRRSMML